MDIRFVRQTLQFIPNFAMKCMEKSWLLQTGFSAAIWTTVLLKLTDRKSWDEGCLIKTLTAHAKTTKPPGKHQCQMRIHSPCASPPLPFLSTLQQVPLLSVTGQEEEQLGNKAGVGMLVQEERKVPILP